jgi:hypothetical protein
VQSIIPVVEISRAIQSCHEKEAAAIALERAQKLARSLRSSIVALQFQSISRTVQGSQISYGRSHQTTEKHRETASNIAGFILTFILN